MELIINQHKISLSSRYKIFKEGQQIYAASKRFFSWPKEIVLKKIETNEPIIIATRDIEWFSKSYDIEWIGKGRFEFRCVNRWQSHYECSGNNEYYEILANKGRKYSVFKNREQIAWWDKDKIKWLQGDNYKIISNNDDDHKLVVFFCLLIDNIISEGDYDTAVTVDFGNSTEKKVFDINWNPKS